MTQIKQANWAYRIMLALVCLPPVLLSCNKEDIALYKGDTGIYFYESPYSSTNDSVTFSFATKSSEVTSDTIWLPVNIMGVAADHDREVKLAIVDSLTNATEGKHYKLLTPYIIPAGIYRANLGVVLFRTVDLQDTTYRLGLKLLPSEDFPLSLQGKTDYLISVNDILTEPSNWNSFLKYIFGTYSQVKYRFIIDVTGIAEFPTGPAGFDYGQLLYYKGMMQNALNDYNDAHPGAPMKDEFGNQVTF